MMRALFPLASAPSHSLLLLLLGSIAVAGCGSDSDSGTADPEADASDATQGGDSTGTDSATDADPPEVDADAGPDDTADSDASDTPGEPDGVDPDTDATPDGDDADVPDATPVDAVDSGGDGTEDGSAEPDGDDGSDVEVPAVPESWDVCIPIIGTAVAQCVEEQLLDPELAFSRGGRQEALARCAEAEAVATAYDRWCASPSADAFGCGIPFEDWYASAFPPCLQELSDWNYGRTCVFGPQWRTQDLEPAIREIYRAWYDTPFAFRTIDASQLVRAVQLSGSPEVSTLDDALGTIDGGEARRIVLWDTSARTTWVLWEFGRGDNSYGAWFDANGTEAVGRVVDGDTYDCSAFYGDEMRACRTEDQCADGLRCVGTSEFGEGRCVNLTLDPPDLATPCAIDSVNACGDDTALLCSGATNEFGGQCRPAWMRGSFGVAPETEGDDSDPQGLRSQILVGGLATVSTDVTVRIVLQHPDMTQVSLTLANPAGTVVPIALPPAPESFLVLEQAVSGFPGDESANGLWTLTVTDSVADGQQVFLQEWTLRLGSRWD